MAKVARVMAQAARVMAAKAMLFINFIVTVDKIRRGSEVRVVVEGDVEKDGH